MKFLQRSVLGLLTVIAAPAWASRDFSGTDQNLSLASAVASGTPLSMCAWVKLDAAPPTGTRTVFSVGTSGANNHRWSIEVANGSGAIRAVTRDTGSNQATSSTAVSSTSTWYHVCAVFSSATSRAAYLNGGGKGTETTSRTPSGFNQIRVGEAHDGIQDFDGKIAHVALWSVALSDAEVTELYSGGEDGGSYGENPLNVQSGNLIGYWPLTSNSSPEPDDAGSNDLTVNGATFSSDNPNVDSAGASAPTFSVAPAIGTRTTSSIPITATTACTDCTFYGVAVTDGSGAPTCTQVKAGQNSGGTSAYKSFSQSMTGGAQGTGTFSTYTDGTVRDGYFCLNSTANGDSASVSSIADMYKVPAFSSNPALSSAGTASYTISKTLDGAGTVYGVACRKGATAPSVSNVEAGLCANNGALVEPARYPLELVSPRASGTAPSADAGTPNMPSGHRIFKAYPGIEYNIRAVVIGGAFPYSFALSNEPSGMTINSSTGVISWPNPTGTTETPTVTVTDAEGTQASGSWAISITTTGFKFVSTSGNNGNAGTLASPWATIAGVRANSSAGDIVYFRAGTYDLTGASADDTWGPQNILGFPAASRSVQWLEYPGESVIFDLDYDAGSDDGYILRFTGSSTYPVYFDGFDGTNALSIMYQYNSGSSDYNVWRNLEIRDIVQGINGGNPAGIMTTSSYADPSVYSAFQDIEAHDNTEAGPIKLYSCRKCLWEDLHWYDQETGPDLKAHVPRFEVRTSLAENISEETLFGNMDANTSGEPATGEIRFNNLNTASTSLYTLDVNQQGNAGEIHIYRNTIRGRAQLRNVDSSDGPFRYKRNVIINSDSGSTDRIYLSSVNTNRVEYGTGSDANLTGAAADNIVDADGELQGSYLTNNGPTTANPRGHAYSTGSGTGTAIASANDDATGTFTLGSSLTRYTHDLYVVGTYGSQHEASVHTLSNQLLDPGAGYQFTTLASVSATSPCYDINLLAVPEIAASDILKTQTTLTPDAFALTVETDCDMSYSGTSARQSTTFGVYDDSVGDLMSGSASLYFNNPGPVAVGPSYAPVLSIGEAFSIDLCSTQFTHASGDTLTGTHSSVGTGTGTDSHPTATSFGGTGNCTWSGTPEDVGTGSFVFTATDLAGATADMPVNWEVVGSITVPDCTTSNLTLGACLDLLDAAMLVGSIASLECNPSVASGSVISQDPEADETADLFSEVALTVSRGSCSGTRGLGLGLRIRIH